MMPPLTMDLSEEELRGIIEEPIFVDLPCHTTAVERGVKGTTVAALKYAKPTERDVLTFQKEDSRNISNMTKNLWNLK